MAEIASGEVLLHRKRGRQQIELVEAATGRADIGRDLVTAPQVGLEVRMPVVVDNEP